MNNIRIKKAVIREDLLSIVSDFREAIILNQFIYWSQRVSDADLMIEKENEIAKRNGEEEREPLYGWIYKSASELSEEIMLGLSDSQIRRYINNLVEYGYILKRTNPKYKWDKTLQYKVNLVNIARALKKNGYPLSDYKIELPCMDSYSNAHACAMVSASVLDQKSVDDGAIPENIYRDYNTENTNSENTNIYAFVRDKSGENESKKIYCHKYDYSMDQLKEYIQIKIPMLIKKYGPLKNGKQSDLIKIIIWFYLEYNKIYSEPHPILSDFSFQRIICAYDFPPDTMHEYKAYDFEDYKEMIKRYFEIDFGKYQKTQYGSEIPVTRLLSHFMSDEIREHIYRQIMGL